MNYNVDYYIKKFEAISEDLWCVWTQFDDQGRSCAFGHCNGRRAYIDDPEYKGLQDLSLRISHHLLLTGQQQAHVIADINNGEIKEYQQATPKQRVLAVLYDLKKLEQPAVKERTVYVTVDQSVRELQKNVELKTLLN